MYLQCGVETPGTAGISATALAKGRSETAFVPEASSHFSPYSSRVLAVRQVPWLPSADGRRCGSAASSSAGGCRPSLCWPEQPRLGSRVWYSRAQYCLMIHSNSLFIPLGTQKGGREQISTPQTQFPRTPAHPSSEPMSSLKGSMENMSE